MDITFQWGNQSEQSFDQALKRMNFSSNRPLLYVSTDDSQISKVV
jgi:hypothetical protein